MGSGNVKMQLFIVNLVVCWLAWLCNIVLAQFELSETVTGSVSFPDVGITCVGNLAVFITSLLRERLHLEMGVRDVLAIVRGPEPMSINKSDFDCNGSEGFGKPAGKTGQFKCCLSHWFKKVLPPHGTDSQALSPLGIDSEILSSHGTECEALSVHGIDSTMPSEESRHSDVIDSPSPSEKSQASLALLFASPSGEILSSQVVRSESSVSAASVSFIGLSKLRPNSTNTHPSVLMLSKLEPNSSMKQFRKYISNAHHVSSMQLQFLPYKEAIGDESECRCRKCRCIVFWTVEEIASELAERIPGTLKRLSDSMCLIPSAWCLSMGCHGCNEGLLHTKERRLTEGVPNTRSPAAVSQILDYFRPEFIGHGCTCICIPLSPRRNDTWTNLLIRSLKSKDKEDRGVIGKASDVLRRYVDGTEEEQYAETEKFSTSSFILPRLIEVTINLLLTGFFKVDGLSSALTARRSIRHYLLDSKGSGFAANAFISQVSVMAHTYDEGHTDFCQVLVFRGNFLTLKTLSFMVGGVNLICAVIWAVLFGFEGGVGKWYHRHSMPPSVARVVVVIVAIAMALGLDCLHVYSITNINKDRWKKIPLVWAGIGLEIMCIVLLCCVLGGLFGRAAFGTWIYSALQGLAWVKWGIGSYILGEYLPDYNGYEGYKTLSADSSGGIHTGILVYSSAFLLNALLAAVRGNWDLSV